MTSDSLRGNIQATIDRLVDLQKKVEEAADARPDDGMAQAVSTTWGNLYEVTIASLRDILKPGANLPFPAYFADKEGDGAPVNAQGAAEPS